MLSIEDQIGRIADAAFDDTSPVVWTSPDGQANARASRHRGRSTMLVAASVLAVALISGLVLLDQNTGEAPTPRIGSTSPSGSLAGAPTLPATSTAPDTSTATSTDPSSSATTVAPSTGLAAATPQRPWRVVPYGASPTGDPFFQVRETNVNSTVEPDSAGPGDVVLIYEVGITFNPDGRSSTLMQMSPTSTDGELATEVSCLTEGCLELEPVNDFVQTSLQLTVRRTDLELTVGAHSTEFELHFDDGTIGQFSIGQFAEPEPSVSFAQQVASSSGRPAVVQEVFAQGSFPYHAISAFDSIWVVDKYGGLVTRIDSTTGAVLATIETSRGNRNRLTASDTFIYVVGSPVYRIDPSTNTATAVPGTNGLAIAATNDDVVFTADYQNKQIQRVGADGSVATLDLPADRWMDMTITHGMVWALSQTRPIGRLIAFDLDSGKLRYDIPIDVRGDGYPVRLVSDETSVVVGADGGVGGNGELFVIDPSTGTIVGSVALAIRPEGIVLTPNHIWTSAAVLDRRTLDVLNTEGFGFTITRGPDGSIWGTGGVPSAQSGTFIVGRTAPGDFQD